MRARMHSGKNYAARLRTRCFLQWHTRLFSLNSAAIISPNNEEYFQKKERETLADCVFFHEANGYRFQRAGDLVDVATR